MPNLKTNFRRVLKAGFVGFWRNGVVSVASIFVVVVTLFIIGSLFMSNAFLTATLGEIKDKVDINVYFKTTAKEEEVLIMKTDIESLPEVKTVEYVSREEALEQFRERNKDNTLVLQALDELNDNPLGAVLNIKAKEPSQYEGIAQFLNRENEEANLSNGSSGGVGIIDSINYFKNQVVIEKLNKIIEGARTVGIAIALILGIMAVLVTFNTIRLAIYNSRNEIYVMRLVGANSSFIRGPFVVEGVMYGGIAALISLVLLFPATYWLSRTTTDYFGGINLFKYFLSNFGQMFIVLVVIGIVLGTLSSYIAVRRYLH
ncbi:MAG TPA: permease-like cell division protein FtsX [Candidatus Paceibacterota bacterium]